MLKQASAGGFDAVIETSAAEAGIGTAVAALKPRGRLVLAGISFKPQAVPTLAIVVKEISLKASYAYLADEFDVALEFMANKRLNAAPLVSRIVTLDEVPEAFDQLAEGASETMKMVIRP